MRGEVQRNPVEMVDTLDDRGRNSLGETPSSTSASDFISIFWLRIQVDKSIYFVMSWSSRPQPYLDNKTQELVLLVE